MSAAINTVEFDHSRLGAKELILLSKLQLGMQFRTPVLIQAEISRQEWQKQGVALLFIGFLFAVLGYLCFQDIEDMYSYVLSVYLDAVEEKVMSSDKQDVERWLLEQGRCLWMRREEGEMWTPPVLNTQS